MPRTWNQHLVPSSSASPSSKCPFLVGNCPVILTRNYGILVRPKVPEKGCRRQFEFQELTKLAKGNYWQSYILD